MAGAYYSVAHVCHSIILSFHHSHFSGISFFVYGDRKLIYVILVFHA